MDGDQFTRTQLREAYQWLLQGERRRRVLASFTQPLTVKQISKNTAIAPDACSYVLWELAIYGLVTCLNDQARSSRVYWLSELGSACLKRLRENEAVPDHDSSFPHVDWEVYGWVNFSHRKAVITALNRPMQPVDIKRRAMDQNPRLRMSANNVRDVIRLFLKKRIVKRISIPGKRYVHYDLTDRGRQFKDLIWNAEAGQ